jgi:hypothetical protein
MTSSVKAQSVDPSYEKIRNAINHKNHGAYNGNVVVVVDTDQLSELQVTSLGSGLRGNTLHSTSISEETVGVVVEELETGLVEAGGEVSLSHGKTDGIGETLSKRTSGDLNTGGVVSLGVTGGLGSKLLQFSVFVSADT